MTAINAEKKRQKPVGVIEEAGRSYPGGNQHARYRDA
jgi:hypothetical protein